MDKGYQIPGQYITYRIVHDNNLLKLYNLIPVDYILCGESNIPGINGKIPGNAINTKDSQQLFNLNFLPELTLVNNCRLIINNIDICLPIEIEKNVIN